MDCVFCAIVAGQAPAAIIYQDEHTMAFMDINPVAEGHALVIPKIHVQDIYEIDVQTAAAVMHTVVKVARAIGMTLRPDGINLFQANGRAANQSVFHFHVHVIPRRWDDGIRPPWRLKPGDWNAITQTAAAIRAQFISDECSRPGGAYDQR